MCRGPGARAARAWSVEVERMISPNRAEAGPENTAGTGRPWFSASTCARDTSPRRSTKCGGVSRGREATVGRDGTGKGRGRGVALRANTMRSQPLPISAYGSQDEGRWCRGMKGRGDGRERERTSADNSHKKTRRCLPPPRTKWTRRVPHPVLNGQDACKSTGRETTPEGNKNGVEEACLFRQTPVVFHRGAQRRGLGRRARACVAEHRAHLVRLRSRRADRLQGALSVALQAVPAQQLSSPPPLPPVLTGHVSSLAPY
jgi:hypothetical protein